MRLPWLFQVLFMWSFTKQTCPSKTKLMIEPHLNITISPFEKNVFGHFRKPYTKIPFSKNPSNMEVATKKIPQKNCASTSRTKQRGTTNRTCRATSLKAKVGPWKSSITYKSFTYDATATDQADDRLVSGRPGWVWGRRLFWANQL